MLLFGVDGSRVELPRTRANQRTSGGRRQNPKRRRKRRRYSTAAARKKAETPQMWLTTLLHVGTGLPWNWRLGPGSSSEREHLTEMLGSLPPQSMVAADAGFVGYQSLRAVPDGGHELLLRVGAKVRLLKQLGGGSRNSRHVYLWPDQVARRQQRPLVLRLVEGHDGRHPICVVTSVLSPRALSDRQVLELDRRRWGIELFYRHLKQTFQRRKLRSASAQPAQLELQWSLLGLWAMSLDALKHLEPTGVEPRRMSCAGVLRSFRRTMRHGRSPVQRDEALAAC